MDRWEYRVVPTTIKTTMSDWAMDLNALGAEGWEIIGHATVWAMSGAGPVLLAKRKIA